MNKSILLSLALIGVVGAIATGATISYFTDTETSTGNTFTAGTIDIDIDNENPWTSNYNIGDLKPGEVGYINFQINNVGANPVDVSKKLYDFVKNDSGENYDCGLVVSGASYNASSEPECVAENGTRIDNVETQILYDLSVEVYDASGIKIWWQTIYEANPGQTLSAIYGTGTGNYVALGMIPANGYMLVTQSYHFDANAGNEYQGDGLTFSMEVLGEQLTGANGTASVVLENKGGAPDWNLILGDGIKGTLEYETNGPEFVYTFSGKAPLASHNYVLAIGLDGNTDVDTTIVNVFSDGGGNIAAVSGSIELGKDMMGVKAWLVPAENWSNPGMNWNGPPAWPTCVPNFLWETGLVWYNDTDL